MHMEKETKTNLRLIKSSNNNVEEYRTYLEDRFNKLIIQALCFKQYYAYSELISEYKNYREKNDLSILAKVVKSFEGLILFGQPSVKSIDTVRFSLLKVKESLNGITLTEENSTLIKKLTKLLIKSAILDDKKNMASLLMISNNFRVSKNFNNLESELKKFT